MSIPLPNLDDRRWSDLVEEGRALIPLHAPEWTDHNIHDPGITLVELLAWVAEMDIYELNRVPERHKLKFLRLAGIVPASQRAARTVLSFTLSATAPEPLLLTQGTEFAGQDAFGIETRFRTLESLAITRAVLVSVFRVERQNREDLTERWQRGATVEPFGPEARRGTECYFVFSQALPTGQPVNLFFTFKGDHASADARDRLALEAQERERRCPSHGGPACEQNRPPAEEPLSGLTHHSVRLAWEYTRQASGGTEWVALDPENGELDDDTRAFTLNGRVRLTVPEAMASPSGGSFLIRCRLEAGSYDDAPVILNLCLNGVGAEQAVPVGSATGIDEENIEAVRVGVSNGMPVQQFKLSELSAQEDGFREFTPVQEISFRLFTLSPGTWLEWEKRADFDASGRDAIHYVLDAPTGTITFGDGEHGQVPARGAVIYAAYRATRADASKLAAGAVQTLVNSLHNRALFGSEQALLQMRTHFATITNPVPALGGAAAEALSAAEARAIKLREAPLRAVTLSDFKSLALATPGTQLARVEALANSHPSFPCVKATGVVTLIVLSYLPRAKPMPSPGLCRALAAYLAGRRLLGTRVEIVAPTYLEVGVQARVRAAATTDKNVLRQTIVDALDKFLHPLEGGPNGTGWPFGRDVYRSEVLQVIDQIAGVEHVLSLDLVTESGEPQCGNVCLAPTWLTVAGEHRIEVI